MTWESWGDFFAMGGYALYVWGSFGAVFALLLAEVAGLARRRKALLSELTRRKREVPA